MKNLHKAFVENVLDLRIHSNCFSYVDKPYTYVQHSSISFLTKRLMKKHKSIFAYKYTSQFHFGALQNRSSEPVLKTFTKYFVKEIITWVELQDLQLY